MHAPLPLRSVVVLPLSLLLFGCTDADNEPTVDVADTGQDEPDGRNGDGRPGNGDPDSGQGPGDETTAPRGTYPGFRGSGGNLEPLPGANMQCFFPAAGPRGAGGGNTPAASVEYVLEAIAGVDTVHVRLTLDPDFVDNSYGEGSIGWGKDGQQFKKLVGSDHAQLLMYDGDEELAITLRLDYISKDKDAPSGYANLGVADGDGDMEGGDPDLVVATMTSLDRNLNERGYGTYVEDSPLTDDDYTPNRSTPNWDYRVIYEAWVSQEAFEAGFWNVELEYIHASPSKSDSTIVVDPGPCPPDWGCDDPNGCDDPPGDDPPSDPPGDDCRDPDGCDGNPGEDPECDTDDDCDLLETCSGDGICLPIVQ